MHLARFMSWSQNAQAGKRADAAADLARTYLYGELDAKEAEAAELALTSAVDDPSPVVRRAMAEALAGAEHAPRHLVVALAHDQSDVSSLVLSRSVALRETDLVDAASVADAYAQASIAIRPTLGVAVTGALAEIGGREACIAMTLNPGAELAPAAMARMLQRFGDDAELREALLGRDGLPAAVRHELAAATTRALIAMTQERGWLSAERSERLEKDSRERAAVIIASDSDGAPLDLARHLRRVGQLTPGLLLRSLLSGERAFFAAAMADLSEMDVSRVQGLMRDPSGAGFSAMCSRAGLPAALTPCIRAAVAACRSAATSRDGRLSLQVVSAVVDACERTGGEALGKAMALLRRFEAEAARDEARRAAEAVEADRLAAILEDERLLAEQAETEALAIETAAAEALELMAEPVIMIDAEPVEIAPPVELSMEIIAAEEAGPGAPEVVSVDAATVARQDAVPERRGLRFPMPRFGFRAA